MVIAKALAVQARASRTLTPTGGKLLDADQVPGPSAGVAFVLNLAAMVCASRNKEVIMSQSTPTPNPEFEIPDEPVPLMQQLLDNPFLLLFLGIATPTVLYIVWGVMEIANIPVMK